MSIEQQTARTLLQEPIPVTIGGKVYQAPVPTLGTLVNVSALIGTLHLPDPGEIDPEELTHLALESGEEAEKIAEIIAVFIAGTKKEPWWYKYLHERLNTTKRLKNRILDHVTIREAVSIITELIQALNLADFFVLTAFLKGLNVTKRTKTESGTEATASGQ